MRLKYIYNTTAMITIAPNDKEWNEIAALTGDNSWRSGPMRGSLYMVWAEYPNGTTRRAKAKTPMH